MHQYLVQHDVVADGNSIDQTQLVSKTPCVRAAPFDEVRPPIRAPSARPTSRQLHRGKSRDAAGIDLAANLGLDLGLDFAAVGTAVNQNDDFDLRNVRFRHRFVGMVVH